VSPVSAEERAAKMQSEAAQALSLHQLFGETYWDGGRGARWCVGIPNDSTGRTEIIAGILGSLVVHGDYDFSRFANYGDHADAWSRLLWMADCTDLGYYVAQKAAIGSRMDATWEYDEAVARFDLARHIEDYKESGFDHSKVIAILEEATHYTENETELRGFISSVDDQWDLWELTIGKALSWNVVIGHAALVRCAALLRERHGNAGPPETRPAVASLSQVAAP